MILRFVVLLSLCAPALLQETTTWQPGGRKSSIEAVKDQSLHAQGLPNFDSLQPAVQPVIRATDDAIWPTHSSHRCVGVPRTNLTCHFSDLVYDINAKEFIYFPSPGANTNEVSSIEFLENSMKIRIASPRDIFPKQGTTCDELEPAYLYSMLQPASFAHMLRETLVIMYANLHALDLDHEEYRILVVRSVGCNECAWYYEGGIRLISRYAQWAGINSETFEHATQTCNGSVMLFRTLAISSLLLRNEPKYDTGVPLIKYFGGCDGPMLRQFRDAAFKRLGFTPLQPASAHAPLKVLFHDKLTTDKRRIVNIPELVGALRTRFPHIIIDSKVISVLSPREQLAELGSTSILITPHGSSSYRSIFLPDGAQMIVIGPDEKDGVQWGAWSEFTDCWSQVTYFKYHCYHCLEAAETRERAVYVPPGSDVKAYHWWRSDKVVKADKLGDMVAVAVASIVASAAQSLPNGTFVAFDNSNQECFKSTGWPK